MGPEHASSAPKALSPEIQALRAIAVALVVAYHVWPNVLPGGFVGVDVFFAISGYLITSLLLHEIDRNGRLSLTAFWARRARRILPAALTTLLFCAVATALFVPLTYWGQFFGEMRASTEYVQNWHLATAAVDYFHAEDAPSPVQHFWSLSVEEQFYVLWPVLLVGVLAATRKRPVRVRRASIAVVMAALTAVSLTYSIVHTPADPAAAYFVTPTRAWEFGAGGLLALVRRGPASRGALSSALCWVGLAAIGVAASTYTTAIAFPGYAALLPVLGALAVMHAGTPERRWSPAPVMRVAPVQRLGDISYSVYLWHWPLLVLAPFVIGASATQTRIGVLLLTLVAASITKLVIEDPVRRGRFLTSRHARWTFALAAVASAAVIAVTSSAGSYVRAQMRTAERAAQRTVAAKPACFGAAARDSERPCDNAALVHTVVPSPIVARKLDNAPCDVIEKAGRVRVCAFGVSPSRANRTVALIGDSHASHWRAALEVVARRERWRGLSVTHTSCPFSAATAEIAEPARSQCIEWKRDTFRWLRRHPEVGTVFVAEHTGGKVLLSAGQTMFAAQVAGYAGAWRALPATVKQIVVIRDTPKIGPETLACVESAMSRHRSAGRACAVPRSAALGVDPAAVAARRLHSRRVQVVDLTRLFCDRRRCYPVIGGALVYKDLHHLTAVFAATLGPPLERQLDALIPARQAPPR